MQCYANQSLLNKGNSAVPEQKRASGYVSNGRGDDSEPQPHICVAPTWHAAATLRAAAGPASAAFSLSPCILQALNYVQDYMWHMPRMATIGTGVGALQMGRRSAAQLAQVQLNAVIKWQQMVVDG